MRTLIALLLVAPIIMGCVTPSQIMLDAEVRRLCAIDGGIKVYETVRLPPEKFNQYGQVNFYKPTQGENALGVEYILKIERQKVTGNPDHDPTEASISRTHSQVIRKIDMKLLGETVIYLRVGGDVPGPWHSTSITCPDVKDQGEAQLLKQIFLQAAKGE